MTENVYLKWKCGEEKVRNYRLNTEMLWKIATNLKKKIIVFFPFHFSCYQHYLEGISKGGGFFSVVPCNAYSPSYLSQLAQYYYLLISAQMIFNLKLWKCD